LLLGLMVLVSLYATYDVAVSLPKVAGIVLGLGVFFSVARAGLHPGGWWLGFTLFLVLGSGVAGAGLLGTQWIAKWPLLASVTARLPFALTGLPGAEEGLHPNQVAGSLLWVAPVATIFAIASFARRDKWQASLGYRRARLMRVLLLVSVLLMTGTLILTQSRSGYIGFIAGWMAVAVLVMPRRMRWMAGSVLIVVVSAAALVVFELGNNVIPQIPRAGVPTDATWSLDTLEGRFEVWSRAIYAIQDFPITGMGLNAFRNVAPVLYPLFLVPPDYDIAHAHNEFLQAALDLGLPGLIAFSALYISAFGMLRRIWRSAESIQWLVSLRVIALGLGGGLFAHAVYGMTDAVALGAKPGVLFWVILGLIVGLFEQVERTQRAPPILASSQGQASSETALAQMD